MNRQQRRAEQRAQRRRPQKPARVPRQVQNPVEFALAAVRPLTEEQQQTLGIRTHGAMHAITHGHGTEADAAMLASMTSVTLLLVEMVTAQAAKKGDADQVRVAAEALQIVKRAQAALLQMHERAQRGGSYGFAGPELTAVNECVELHDQFAQMAPQALMERAVRQAMARHDAGHVARSVEALGMAA